MDYRDGTKLVLNQLMSFMDTLQLNCYKIIFSTLKIVDVFYLSVILLQLPFLQQSMFFFFVSAFPHDYGITIPIRPIEHHLPALITI